MSAAVDVMAWLLDADPAIGWQVMRYLLDEPAEVVASTRARVAFDGWGAQLLGEQRPDGNWGDDVATPRWRSNLFTLDEAVGLVVARRQPDGRWLLDDTHRDAVHGDLEAGAGEPSRWNTLRALRVLRWHSDHTRHDHLRSPADIAALLAMERARAVGG